MINRERCMEMSILRRRGKSLRTIAPARGPPRWDLPDAGTGDFDPRAQPAPPSTRSLRASLGDPDRPPPVARDAGQAHACGGPHATRAR